MLLVERSKFGLNELLDKGLDFSLWRLYYRARAAANYFFWCKPKRCSSSFCTKQISDREVDAVDSVLVCNQDSRHACYIFVGNFICRKEALSIKGVAILVAMGDFLCVFIQGYGENVCFIAGSRGAV